MKRFTVIFIGAVLCVGLLAGCNSPQTVDAYNLYMKMSQAMDNLKSIDMDMSILIDVNSSEDAASISTNANMKKLINSKTDIDILIIAETESNGTGIHSSTSYYTGGASYFEIAGKKYYEKLSAEDALHGLPYIYHSHFLEFPESAIKDFKISNQDGGKKVELTLDGNAVTSIEKEQSFDDFKISDIVCEFIVDKDNILKSHHIIYEKSMKFTETEFAGMTQIIKTDVTLTVNSYNDVTIDFPSDLDEYVEYNY